MNDIAGLLHDAIEQQGIPIEGVSIGRRNDRATWRIDFAVTASDEQRAQAAVLLAAFDPDTAITAEEIDRAGVTAKQVITLLKHIAARQAQIDTERAVVASDLTALNAATTLAQVKPIVTRLLQRQDNALTAEKRSLEVLDRVLRALRRLVS